MPPKQAVAEPEPQTVPDDGSWDLPEDIERAVQEELDREDAGIAEPEAPTSPEAESSTDETAGDVEEEQAGEGTGDSVSEFFQQYGEGATAEQIRGLIESLPEELVDEALAEKLRRAEQRGRNQAAEAVTQQLQAREAARGVIDAGREAASRIQRAVGQDGELDRALGKLERMAEDAEPEEIKRVTRELVRHLFDENDGVVPNINAYIAGQRREAAQGATADLSSALNESFAALFAEKDGTYDLTDAEKSRIDEAQTAGKKMGALAQIALDRAKAEGEKGAYDKALAQARKELGVVERIEKLRGKIPLPKVGGRAQHQSAEKLRQDFIEGKPGAEAAYNQAVREGRISESFDIEE